MFTRAFTVAELAAKGLAFGCRGCGQCVLTRTKFICPMTCPKGLRNGPCGGTLDARCEVHRERACVWTRIDVRRHAGRVALPMLLDAPDSALFGTASWLNLVSGADVPGRTPLAYLDLPEDRRAQPARTASRLEAALKAGAFVVTTEVRAPRGTSLRCLERAVAALGDGYDAINATAFLAGQASLPSVEVAAELKRLGCEAMAQATGRDFTRQGFLAELLALQRAGVANLLCLTGDWAGGAGARWPFGLDAALMLHDARWLAERAGMRDGPAMPEPPRPLLAAAINPNATPLAVTLRRLAQKYAAGADLVQTQLVFDAGVFRAFMAGVRAHALARRGYVLAGIPVVTSLRALDAVAAVPGVRLPPAVDAQLRAARDLPAAGVALACALADACRAAGADGVHLMLFGGDHRAVAAVRDHCQTPAGAIP